MFPLTVLVQLTEIYLLKVMIKKIPLCDLIGRSKLLELAQGHGRVAPDPFSLVRFPIFNLATLFSIRKGKEEFL